MDQRTQILNRLQVMDVSPKRSLGQNFLVSEGVIDHIVMQARSFKPQALIEIGPGLGSLTEKLLGFKIPTHLIELDREFAAYWKKLAGENSLLQVTEADALQIEWESLVAEASGSSGASNILLISNLPYQIGARVVIDRSVGPLAVSKMILMFQKEVAQRLMAQPRTKDYGFLTVVAQAEWTMRNLLEAGPRDFYPAPKISSRVVIFERKSDHTVDDFFVEFVKKAFSQRRKFMLKSFGPEKERLLALLQTLGYDEKVRAEEISVEHFCQLARQMR